MFFSDFKTYFSLQSVPLIVNFDLQHADRQRNVETLVSMIYLHPSPVMSNTPCCSQSLVAFFGPAASFRLTERANGLHLGRRPTRDGWVWARRVLGGKMPRSR